MNGQGSPTTVPYGNPMLDLAKVAFDNLQPEPLPGRSWPFPTAAPSRCASCDRRQVEWSEGAGATHYQGRWAEELTAIAERERTTRR
jgi:hypothetical protein